MILKLDHFDLDEIAGSGQCFRFKKISEDEFGVVAYGRFLTVKKVSEGYEFSCSQEEWNNIFSSYFDAETDYNRIEKLVYSFDDAHLIEAFEKGRGIRILQQDLWEIIISFLISQNNNIPRIKNSIEALCRAADLKAINNSGEYRFPMPGEISPSLFDDVNLGLGYRAPYLKEMYEYAADNPEWLDALRSMPYEEARHELLLRKGIGPKVADCICLFGLHHIDAFPIDTHIKQLLAKYYPSGFPVSYFEGCAGVIQQYLFYYEIKPFGNV